MPKFAFNIGTNYTMKNTTIVQDRAFYRKKFLRNQLKPY
jgi:hypothetical protein